ncbi:hypothetical protein LJC34_05450 [Oscillospiraceae bacterium OttesenSCG-928-G22]|nr:hypothetical protein [Oscillospiraceae bacterium OttesenSCG-928-G22]
MNNGNQRAKKCNTFKAGFEENAVFLDFGYSDELEKGARITQENVNDISMLRFPPEMLPHLAVFLINLGIEYEVKYNKTLGFDKVGLNIQNAPGPDMPDNK